MLGKRAKILSPGHVEDLMVFAAQTRHPLRNQVLVLLSFKAGLRASEIANLTWPMLVEPTGEIGTSLELQDGVAKKASGRVIPIHPDLYAALVELGHLTPVLVGPVIRSERGGPMMPVSIVCWFAKAYPGNWLGRLLVPFGPPDLHYSGGPAGAQCRWFVARCAAAGGSSVNPDHSAVHRRRHRCPA